MNITESDGRLLLEIFINYFTSDDKERNAMLKVADQYIEYNPEDFEDKCKCLGCIKLDLMAMCEDNEIMKERIREYFESEDVGGY